MSGPERFSIVAPLPPLGVWRRALALDRSATPPLAVALSYVPQAMLDDAARLAALVRDVEAAGRLHHPSAVPVLGTVTAGDALVVVEAHRAGTTLRALLDAGGRLPPDVAVRIAVDACAAVARAHALDAGDGRKLVHGAIGPARIVVADEGGALVAGFGTGAAAEPADDVRALAAVLHECLSGEPPGTPPASLEDAGVLATLAAAVSRGLGAAPDGPRSAAGLAEELVAAAGAVASHADVAAYVDAILPPNEGARAVVAKALAVALGGGEAEEVSADLIVEPTDPALAAPRPPEPTLEPLPRPPATRPGVDPAGVFAAPARPARRSRAPLVALFACGLLGLAGGYAGARFLRTAGAPSPAPARAAEAPAPSRSPPPPQGVAAPAAAPLPPEEAGADVEIRPPVRTHPPRPAKPQKRAVKQAAKATLPAPARGKDGKGMLHVAAPADAEVFLDEKRIGKGTVHLEIPEGAHKIEVRLGPNRVAQSFSVAAGETWTYDVTPTP